MTAWGVPSRTFTLLAALALASLTGCSTAVASALDEPEANRVMVALDRAHVAASKEPDAVTEGKFRVVVAADDAPRALGALRAEELPRSKPLTMADAAGKGSLVPSPATEQAQISAAMAGELERSLEGIEGVLSARVHLNTPVTDPLQGGPKEKASASVLIAYRGSPPIAEAAVQRLVAGGAPNMATADVAVVMIPRSVGVAEAEEASMARLGPFGVARASLRPIQLVFMALLALSAFLALGLVLMGARLARLRAALEESKVMAR